MDALQSGLRKINVYPHRYLDTSKPTGEYPLLASSPYPELSLNSHVENIYERSEEPILLYSIYPYIWDSASTPNFMEYAAKRIDKNAVVKPGWIHAFVSVQFDGGYPTSYGGNGEGGSRPVYITNINKDFLFDGSANDLNGKVAEQYSQRLLGYKEKASKDSLELIKLLNGEIPNKIIGSGSWIEIAVEGSFSYGKTLTYYYPVRYSNEVGSKAASRAWVDGRYVNGNERLELGVKFEDYPTATIILPGVTFTDNKGEVRTETLEYLYDNEKDNWRVIGVSGLDETNPAYSLTRSEVEALNVDRNTNFLPENVFIYSGDAQPGTPLKLVRATGIQAPESISLRQGINTNAAINLGIKVVPDNAYLSSFILESKNPEILSVSGYNLEPKKIGTTILTATSYDGRYSKDIKVTVTERLHGWISSGNNWKYIKDNNEYANDEWIYVPVIDSKGQVISKAWKYFNYYGENVESMYHENGDSWLSVKGPYRGYMNGWYKDQGGNEYYFTPKMSKGITKIGQTTYLFNANGHKQYRWHIINNRQYYFDPRYGGGMITGKRKVGETTYLFNSNGYKTFGWHRLNGKDYYFDPNYGGGMVTGMRLVGRTRYLFHNEGYKTYGWHVRYGNVYYFNEQNGGMWTGLRTINGKKYLFHSFGFRLENVWFTNNGKTYFFNPNMYVNTTQRIDNQIYRFGPDGAVIR